MRPMLRLPIDDVLPPLREALSAQPTVVLQAPPGAGKTTRVPLALLDAPWLAGRSIIILEPRRLAARAAATRMANELGEAPGQTVGYRIRFEHKVSKQTRIEVVTEGILTRRLQEDPILDGVGMVIFDEFHERHLHSDLALALCLDAQAGLRDDLRLLVMSATLDGKGIAQRLNAPLIESEGRSYPVDLRYLSKEAEGPLPERIAGAVLTALQNHAGDLLAFLPGSGEIRRTESLLRSQVDDKAITLHPLYGDLQMEAQQHAIAPSSAGHRKVVLATPIAETSLTIEGVTVVIDGGWQKVPRFDPNSGLTRLDTVRVSRASAEQRAGRAGRLGPGVCYRLWSESTQRGLVPFNAPEIAVADLAPLLLELSAWGVSDVNALTWMEAPPAGALAQARTLLTELEALDEAGRITTMGRAMVALPVHPRLAHMMVKAKSWHAEFFACDIAALLSERDLLRGVEGAQSCDFALRIEALLAHRRNGVSGARSFGADPHACSMAERAAKQWRHLLGHSYAPQEDYDETLVGRLLALAYPDRVAQRRDEEGIRYLLANGRGARLDARCGMRGAEYLLAADLDGAGDDSRIRLAAPLTLHDLNTALAHRITKQDVVRWDERTAAIIAQREQRLGALVLSRSSLASPAKERVVIAVLGAIRSLSLEVLPWNDAARELQARVVSLRQWCPDEGLPDLSNEWLHEHLDEWLGPWLDNITRRDHFSRLDLHAILLSKLDWQQQRRLDEGAPTHLVVPSGSHKRLEYIPGQSPILAVKLQELFGLADTPRVAWGRVPVTLHLLSPAQRPIQVTQDLKGFWERTYSEVKKELKGRYPRHPWPDDPWNAVPTARAKPRGT